MFGLKLPYKIMQNSVILSAFILKDKFHTFLFSPKFKGFHFYELDTPFTFLLLIFVFFISKTFIAFILQFSSVLVWLFVPLKFVIFLHLFSINRITFTPEYFYEAKLLVHFFYS